MNRLEELDQEIRLKYQERDNIRARELAEKNSKVIGKYFKGRNSYSCPKPDEYWYEYYYVQYLDENTGEPLVLNFSKDCNGKIEIQNILFPSNVLSSYIQIEKYEFEKEWQKFLSEIVNKY